MERIELEGVRELSLEETERLDGGALPVAIFLVGCFAAGFKFGFEVVGPALFAE